MPPTVLTVTMIFVGRHGTVGPAWLCGHCEVSGRWSRLAEHLACRSPCRTGGQVRATEGRQHRRCERKRCKVTTCVPGRRRAEGRFQRAIAWPYLAKTLQSLKVLPAAVIDSKPSVVNLKPTECRQCELPACPSGESKSSYHKEDERSGKGWRNTSVFSITLA